MTETSVKDFKAGKKRRGLDTMTNGTGTIEKTTVPHMTQAGRKHRTQASNTPRFLK
jgi:hypothetical protein